MSIVHTITGIAALVCFVLLVIKYPLRKLRFFSLNSFLMKLHEAASGIYFLAAIAHIITGFSLIKTSPAALIVSGFAAFVISIVLIAACHMTKDVKKKMYWHRRYSLLMTAAIVIHIFTAWL